MKILLAQKSVYIPTWSGALKSNRSLLEGLAARNHACRVLCLARPEIGAGGGDPDRSAPPVEVFRREGVDVHAVTDPAQFYAELAQHIRHFDPDWTLVSEDRAYLTLAAALEAPPARVVYLAHSQAMLPFGPECFLADPTKTNLLRRAAGIIAVSKYLQEYLDRWGGLASTLFRFPVYGAGPFPRFGVFDRGSVLMVNPSAIKGAAIFLQLARSLPEVPFIAVPTWSTRAADRDALARLPNVRLVPPSEDIDAILAQARVVLVPSLWGESFGYIAVEAMLRGIPVLASNVGGLPEAKLGVDYVLPVRPITRYEERLDELMLPVPVVPEQDAGPWINALRELLSDRGHYERLSAASREAAMRFVSGLSVAPFEDDLLGLAPDPTAARERPLDTPGDGLPKLADHLSPERLELLAQLLRKPAAAPARHAIPALPRGRNPDSFPLSFAQQRLWFLNQLEPGNPAYIVQVVFQMTGALDPAILERCLNEIVKRHEAWRTTFPNRGDPPAQVVAPSVHVALPVVDLRDLPRAEGAAEVREYTVAEGRRSFDLATGPLLRAVLLRTGDKEHVLVLTVHHIAFDFWSKNIFRHELGVLYQAYVDGRPSPLPDLPVQYGDFAHWQRQWLQGEVLANQLGYWKRQLAGPLPALALPADRPRPPTPTRRGALQSLVPPAALFEVLETMSRQEGVTLFMTLLAAFQALLRRYTGQEDIVVGSPIAGRNRVETEGLIGFFVNTLALRTDLSGNPTFRQLLARVREVALAAYAHQDLPFEKLVEELRPPRERGLHPLFQVMLVLQNAPALALELPGLAIETLRFDTGTAAFDWTVIIVRREAGMTVQCEYNADIFDAGTIDRMLGHFQVLLEGIVADPGRRLADLPLLTEPERRQVLVEWNNTATDYPHEACIHHLFEAQAGQRPDADAIVWDAGRWSYCELNQRANRLAHRLRALGVGPEVGVGVCLERSPEAIVALLAIFKAGGAYVPLDPAYPKERLHFMAEDAGLAALVTLARFTRALPDLAATVVYLDADGDVVARQSAANPAAAATPENLAYVMYTSGSTGTPKGVGIPHRGVVRLVQGVAYAHMGPAEVFCHAAPLAFDASTFEIWGCLLNGAKLVIFSGSIPWPEEVAPILRRHRVTILWLTASLFQLYVEHHLDALRTVRQLVVGGDTVSASHVRMALQELPGCRLVNGYGPTEATTFTCCHPVTDTGCLGASVPIGRPLANTRVYILDAHLAPVPIGVPGELYVAGDGLARGYLHRPELTAAKFIPDPFGNEPGARLYRTGDLARYLPDGSIDFLGRLDDQVKVRGFRVEPGEIKAALESHPGVGAAAVLVREDIPGDKRLVAYFVCTPGHKPAIAEVRAFLSQKLPPHMVPSAIAAVNALPLTPSGKVNRQALLAAGPVPPWPGPAHMAPWEPLRILLVQIWEELLNVRPIGVLDDFFALGGHSLLAARMMARVEEVCGRKLPLATLFAGATVEHLACALLDRSGDRQESPLVEVQAGKSRRPFFFVHGDLYGGGLYCVPLARHLGGNQPFYALQPHSPSGRRISATIEAMAADHLQLVRARQPEGPYLLGGYCYGALEALEMAQQLRAEGQRVDLLVLIAPAASPLAPRDPRFSLDREPSVLSANPLPATPDAAALASDNEALALLHFYARVCANYVRQPYPGRVTILKPSEEPRSAAESSKGWKLIADEVAVHSVPGGHLTAITHHVRVVADHLRTGLRNAHRSLGFRS